MRAHERQTSQDLKSFKQSTIENSQRLEVFAKNFKKKPSAADFAVTSATNITKLFDAYRKPEGKGSLARSDSKSKSTRKRSLQKFLSYRKGTDRPCLNPTPPVNGLTTRSKLMRVNSVMGGRLGDSSLEVIRQVYRRFEEYQALVREWQQLQVFDEVDRLIQSLIEGNIRLIEEVATLTSRQMDQQLANCELAIAQLQQENSRIQHQLQEFRSLESLVLPIKVKLMEEYEKSQWSTFILNSLSLRRFNLESFVKETPLYRKWTAPVFESSWAPSDHPHSLGRGGSEFIERRVGPEQS